MNSVQLYWLSKAIDIIHSVKKRTVSEAESKRWCAFITVCDASDSHIGTIYSFTKYGGYLARNSIA